MGEKERFEDLKHGGSTGIASLSTIDGTTSRTTTTKKTAGTDSTASTSSGMPRLRSRASQMTLFNGLGGENENSDEVEVEGVTSGTSSSSAPPVYSAPVSKSRIRKKST